MLFLFFVWSIICSIVNESSQTTNVFQSMFDGFKGMAHLFIEGLTIFDTLVSVFIIFIMAYLFPGNSARKMMEGVFHVFGAGLTVFMIYVLFIVCNPGITLPGSAIICMTPAGSLSINSNPNQTGAIAEIILLMCFYMVITKKGLIRWMYAVASVVHYFVFVKNLNNAGKLYLKISIIVIY